ncbi:hypothetical protein ACLOJK_010678 [Asimina triloba]
MQSSLICLIFLTPIVFSVEFRAEASPAETLIKHLSSFLQWALPSPNPSQTDENFIQFEKGYLVETVLEGRSKLGAEPHSIRVSSEGELYAVDSVNSNIVKITPPLSQSVAVYSRARLIAGSFEGYLGHVDGRPNDARFNHPKGVTMDDKGNLYVADALNLAIRKIGEAGVTTIAGGKSNVAGFADGPSEDAKFSTDFDVIFDGHTCSLLVVDRGNAALRQISLHREDCEDPNSSISSSDILMVVAAVVVGYASCIIKHGFGQKIFSKPKLLLGTSSWLIYGLCRLSVSNWQSFSKPSNNHSGGPLSWWSASWNKSMKKTKFEDAAAAAAAAVKEPAVPVETVGEDKLAEWPSFGQLVIDLAKLALEALGSILIQIIPASLRPENSRNGLTPLKDTLIMPEDIIPASLQPGNSTSLKDSLTMPKDSAEPQLLLHKQRTSLPPVEESLPRPPAVRTDYTQQKPRKSRTATSKDPAPAAKHRSSKSQDISAHGFKDAPQHGLSASKSQKERMRHRSRCRSEEVVFGVTAGLGLGTPKPVEIKSVDYDDPKFDHYNIRSKRSADDLFRF